jgi:hypothetical protein
MLAPAYAARKGVMKKVGQRQKVMKKGGVIFFLPAAH